MAKLCYSACHGRLQLLLFGLEGHHTNFDFQEIVDEAAARAHVAELFRDWSTCARIEVQHDGKELFVVSRAESEAETPHRDWGQPRPA